MLLAIMAMYWQSGTTDIPMLLRYAFPREMQPWLWIAFFASFAVKLPMRPVHTQPPDAHVEAPTAGSSCPRGDPLKMGGYGFLRFSLPFPTLRGTSHRSCLHLGGRHRHTRWSRWCRRT
jgi:NADH-quinone oxidoreductase subunit M